MSDTKEALVIGNGAYSTTLKLDCPPNDARAVATALADLGFHITLGIDVTYDKAQSLAEEFIKRVNVPSTSTSLLYYSGHGLQIEDRNYIVPVDFDHFAGDKITKLVGVQSIVDQMTSATAVRIVLLDACRSNAEARAFVGGKSIQTEKAFFINDRPLPTTGLAELRTAINTFVAFAAAPGEVAYEGFGGARLSPFTASLVNYLDAVDLPISNLMSRVRQDVLKSTLERQRTWDQSSLMVPFYFNPGSLLLFTGNFMALVGLILSMIPFSLVIAWPKAPWAYIVLAAAMPIASLAILLFGTHSVYSRLRGNFRSDPDRSPTVRDYFIASVQKGVLGGYLGSFVASLLISAGYYLSWKLQISAGHWEKPLEPFGKILLEITVATALTTCVLGTCCLFCAQASIALPAMRRMLVSSKVQVMVGSAVGGVIAGLIAAPLLTVYFGLIPTRPEMTPPLLLPGATLGAAILIFSIINFDFDRLSVRRIWTSLSAALAALAGGGAIGLVVYELLWVIGIVGLVMGWMKDNWDNAVILAEGGAIYGSVTGLVLGITCGLAIVFTEKWSRKAILQYPIPIATSVQSNATP